MPNDTKLTYADVSDRLTIDKNQLDTELVTQPQLVYEVGMCYADAMSRKDGYHAEQKEFMARATMRVRAKLEKSGEKVTVAEVTSAVDADDEVVEFRMREQRLADAVRRWDVCVESVKARGYALHKLCELEITQGAAIGGQSEKGRAARMADADAAVQRHLRDRKKGK